MIRKNKIKILFIHHAIGWGGAPKSMINLIKKLDQNKYDIEVLLVKNSIVGEILTSNNIKYSVAKSFFYRKIYHYFTHSEANYVKWYKIPHFFLLSSFWVLSKYIFAKKELSRFEYDIIHLNSSVLTDWIKPGKMKGKVIIHIREPFRKGNFDILHKFFRNQMKRHVCHIIAISQDNSKRVNLEDKTTVIYNFANIETEEIYNNSNSKNMFLYLGGNQLIKGFNLLYEAIPYLNEKNKIFAGGDYSIPNLKHIKKILFKKKLLLEQRTYEFINNEKVIFIGQINNVDEYFRKACCLISPFTIPHFSRPIIEAYLHKKPVIATDIEGMAEIVIDGVTGVLVNKDDPKALGNAINEIAANPKKAEIMGLNGYNFAISRFTSQNVKQYEKIYDEVLSIRMK